MCELYPRYGSCCGIPIRIALIFIAVLSIVTGALINAVIKKAGIDPSSVHSEIAKLKNASLNNFKFEETYDEDEIRLESPTTEFIETTYEDVETTSRKSSRHRSKKTTTHGPYSTVEIIGEDRQREIIRFTSDDDEDPSDNPGQRPQQLHRNRRFKADHDPTSNDIRVLKKTKSSAKLTTVSSNKLRTTKASAILTTAESSDGDTTTESSEEDREEGTVLPFQAPGNQQRPPGKGPPGGKPPVGGPPGGGPPGGGPPGGAGGPPGGGGGPQGGGGYPPGGGGGPPGGGGGPPGGGGGPTGGGGYPPGGGGYPPGGGGGPPGGGGGPPGGGGGPPGGGGGPSGGGGGPPGGGGGPPGETTEVASTIKGKESKKEKEANKEKPSFLSVHLVRAVNTTGINFLGLLFIALGILLLFANLMNSPDLMFMYVVLCVSKSILMLALLLSVVVQCSRAQDKCLLRKLDWFTSFIVTIFWFFYSFVWAFFAAVANGYANNGWGNAL